MGYLGTYKIEQYIVYHPVEGELIKEKIIYYDIRDEIEFDEFYFGYIRNGYTLKK